MPADARPAFAALWDLDLACADVVATSSDPRLGAIRLAWWRDRLADLDTKEPPDEPRLRAVHRQLIGRANGAKLAMITDGWAALLNPFPWGEDVADGLRDRGRMLFTVGSHILGHGGDEAAPAGVLWSLVDGAMHCSDAASRGYLLDQARATVSDLPRRMPRELRPLTILAALAAHDLVRPGRLSRGAAALRHRLFGTFTRA